MCHVQPDFNILFVKLTAQKEDRKTPSAHYASGVGDLMKSLSFFVISLFCLVIIQTGGESKILKCPCWCVEENVGEFVQPRGEEVRTALRFALWD